MTENTARTAPFATDLADDDNALVERMIDLGQGAVVAFGENKVELTEFAEVETGPTAEFMQRIGLGTPGVK